MQQTNFFQDLIVVELASVLAGPAVGLFFAELGATVIKIENKKTKGDVTRAWKLPTEEKQKTDSAYFKSVNWGKESLFLDLTDAIDLAKLYVQIERADVVVCNLKPTAIHSLKVSYKDLKQHNPSLIFAQLTAFGLEKDRLGFDVVLQAEAGFLHMNGEADRPPVKMPVALIDLLAAHQLKEGILLALLHRERTGEGSYLTTSLLESAVASLANQATNWLIGNHIPQRMGTQHPNIAPYGDLFFTKDEKALILAVGNDKQFERLCQLFSLSIPEAFSKNIDRVNNRAALKEWLNPNFGQYDLNDLLPQLHQNGIPAGQIRNMQEVFEQPLAKEMLLSYSDGEQCVKSVAFEWKGRSEELRK